jgi:hypothetical protein
MLIVAIALIAALAVVALSAFIVLCLGIRCEDKAASLGRPAPGFAALLARRFTGLRAQPADQSAVKAERPSSRRIKEVSR